MRNPSACAFLVLVSLGTAIFQDQAMAQNGYSFSDADSSVIDYRAAEQAPVMGCEAIRSMTDTTMAVISAEVVPGDGDIPEHCRVDGLIPSEIGFQLNLPLAWNGRLYMHGNGGYAGRAPGHPWISGHRDRALSNGFVTVYTNTGHDAEAEPLASFAHGNHEKVIDYGFRAVHLTVEAAKHVVAEYYGEPAGFSYWDGCSTGGRQALMSAQRFPDDFDGIVAGAPVLDFTGTMLWGLWNSRAMSEAPISLAQMRVVSDAIYARCDSLDGLEDGIINDPRACDFNPTDHLPRCDAFNPGGGCLTDEQVTALLKIYTGVVGNGEVIFPGQPLGAEAADGWARWYIGEGGPSIQALYTEQFLKFMAWPGDRPEYDMAEFNLDTDPETITVIRDILDATDPDLSAFHDAGGKMISYFGWNDTALTAYMGIDYYEAVREELGIDTTSEFFRFFLAPGMGHCDGGVGPDRIDAMTNLINWVEGGVAPDQIIATREEADSEVMQRPLCPYPETAVYDGSGDPNLAASFSCGTR